MYFITFLVRSEKNANTYLILADFWAFFLFPYGFSTESEQALALSRKSKEFLIMFLSISKKLQKDFKALMPLSIGPELFLEIRIRYFVSHKPHFGNEARMTSHSFRLTLPTLTSFS